MVRFLRAGLFPERAKSTRRGVVDDYRETLKQLWDSGIHNAKDLYRKLRERGFRGSPDAVRRFVAPWRDASMRPHTAGPKPKSKPPFPRPPRIGSKRLSWLLADEDIVRQPHEDQLIEQLCQRCQPIHVAVDLVRSFAAVLKEHSVDGLTQWIERATHADAPVDLRNFAQGLIRDEACVKAAVQLPWSNGRTEGQVNRITGAAVVHARITSSPVSKLHRMGLPCGPGMDATSGLNLGLTR